MLPRYRGDRSRPIDSKIAMYKTPVLFLAHKISVTKTEHGRLLFPLEPFWSRCVGKGSYTSAIIPTMYADVTYNITDLQFVHGPCEQMKTNSNEGMCV